VSSNNAICTVCRSTSIITLPTPWLTHGGAVCPEWTGASHSFAANFVLGSGWVLVLVGDLGLGSLPVAPGLNFVLGSGWVLVLVGDLGLGSLPVAPGRPAGLQSSGCGQRARPPPVVKAMHEGCQGVGRAPWVQLRALLSLPRTTPTGQLTTRGARLRWHKLGYFSGPKGGWHAAAGKPSGQQYRATLKATHAPQKRYKPHVWQTYTTTSKSALFLSSCSTFLAASLLTVSSWRQGSIWRHENGVNSVFTGEDTKFSRGHGPRDRKSDTIVQAHRNEADG
jgi:hypothetical protein